MSKPNNASPVSGSNVGVGVGSGGTSAIPSSDMTGASVAAATTAAGGGGSGSEETNVALKAFFYCSLLALQFGLQPIIASTFTAKNVNKKSVVIATELGKILIFLSSLLGRSSEDRKKVFAGWSIKQLVVFVALPASLYAIQNLCVQYGYQLLDSMTFNLLNQTKTLSAAFWLYIIMNKPQTALQIFALVLLLGAAFLLTQGGSSTGGSGDALMAKMISTEMAKLHEARTLLCSGGGGGGGGGGGNEDVSNICVAIFKGETGNVCPLRGNKFYASLQDLQKTNSNLYSSFLSEATKRAGALFQNNYQLGLLVVGVASMLSGVSAALTQKTLQTTSKDSLFMSAELAAVGILFLLIFQALGGEGASSSNDADLFANWDLLTLIPVSTNAAGGVIVGLVTKYAGGVTKGFALIAGIVITGLVQWVVENKPLGPKDWIAVLLVSVSIYLHSLKQQDVDLMMAKVRNTGVLGYLPHTLFGSLTAVVVYYLQTHHK